MPPHAGHWPLPNLPLPRHKSHTFFVVGSGPVFTAAPLVGAGGLYWLCVMGRRLRMRVERISRRRWLNATRSESRICMAFGQVVTACWIAPSVQGRQSPGAPPMRRTKPDPYDGFKDDRERRRALNVRVRWYASAVMVVAAMTSNPINATEWLQWLMHWFR